MADRRFFVRGALKLSGFRLWAATIILSGLEGKGLRGIAAEVGCAVNTVRRHLEQPERSRQSLASDQDQQSARSEPSATFFDARACQRVSRRTFGADAGRDATATHCEYEVGQATLSRWETLLNPLPEDAAAWNQSSPLANQCAERLYNGRVAERAFAVQIETENILRLPHR
jgi:hypothetical protein